MNYSNETIKKTSKHTQIKQLNYQTSILQIGKAHKNKQWNKQTKKLSNEQTLVWGLGLPEQFKIKVQWHLVIEC